MTQQELAARCACTRRTIVLLELGKYAPSRALAFRLARIFERGGEDVFQFVE